MHPSLTESQTRPTLGFRLKAFACLAVVALVCIVWATAQAPAHMPNAAASFDSVVSFEPGERRLVVAVDRSSLPGWTSEIDVASVFERTTIEAGSASIVVRPDASLVMTNEDTAVASIATLENTSNAVVASAITVRGPRSLEFDVIPDPGLLPLVLLVIGAVSSVGAFLLGSIVFLYDGPRFIARRRLAATPEAK
jgi:hypothetical protein